MWHEDVCKVSRRSEKFHYSIITLLVKSSPEDNLAGSTPIKILILPSSFNKKLCCSSK